MNALAIGSALLRHGALTGNGVENSRFSDFDEPDGDEARATAIRCVGEILKKG